MRDLGLTFAGGGNRAFYQQGLLDVLGERIWPRVAAVASCSAGAAMVTLMLTERREQARARWDALRKGLRRNVDPRRVLRGEPLAPHGRIYRETMIHAAEDGGLERLRAQPFPVYILCSVPPTGVPIGVATWLGLGAYALEKRKNPEQLHPLAGARLGFRELVFDARNCETADELADLILASSATPPFTPLGRFRGRSLLDGGLIDNAPAYVVERVPHVRRNLVLLTRPYPAAAVGERGSRLYLAPTEPVPVERWDYTEDAPVDETLALGVRDAERHQDALWRWLDAGHASEPRANTEAEPSARATGVGS